MGLFNLFKGKNRDELSHEEKEAAQILKNIVHGYKQGDFDYIPNGIERLSIGLYYLSFKRTNKRVVRLEDAGNVFSVLENRKLLSYVGLYKAIKQSIEDFCKDPRVLTASISTGEYEATILTLLKYTAEQIKRL